MIEKTGKEEYRIVQEQFPVSGPDKGK
jgi:hypothetical protein